MTKQITQEERLDLTDKQVREETEAYLNSNTQKIIQALDENTPNGRLYIDKENLIAENERLKEQLDREIKINRKMKSALKKYAECEPLEIKREYFNNEPTHINKTMADIGALAKQVLKEINNKE